MNHCLLTVLATVTAATVANCGSNAPTAPAQAAAGAEATTFSLSGTVADNAIVPIPGALVAIVGGTASTLTDGNGRYTLPGLPAGTVAVRASKDGYVASTNNNIQLPRTFPADFVLAFTGPSFNLAGDYTVTFTADAACSQLPEVVRSRTYRASIPPGGSNDYGVTLSGARFHNLGGFIASVSGRSASFTTAPDGGEAVVHERLGESASIWIDFFARADAIDAPTGSVPMFATYHFCADDNGGGVFSCRVSRITCTSANHRFTLTRH